MTEEATVIQTLDGVFISFVGYSLDAILILKDIRNVTDEDFIFLIIKEIPAAEIIKVKRYKDGIAAEYKFKPEDKRLALEDGYSYSETGISFNPKHLKIKEYL